MKELKWGCIQPLTGGMYIGARNAIGKPADWVISYPGLTDTKKDKNGNLTKVANEYHLLDWCKRNNELPKYKIFNKRPFEQMPTNDVELIDDPIWSTGDIDLSNTDIVVSVPVCSGLSQATIANEDTKNERNYNMIFNALFRYFFQKLRRYQPACGIIGIAQHKNINISCQHFQNIRFHFKVTFFM